MCYIVTWRSTSISLYCYMVLYCYMAFHYLPLRFLVCQLKRDISRKGAALLNHVFVLNSNGYENTVTCIKPYASNNIINQEVKVQHGKIVQDMKTSGQVFDDDRGELITLPPRGQPQ